MYHSLKKVQKCMMSFVMVMVLCSGMVSLPVFAAESYQITIENEAQGHTYEAYQIFKGDYVKDEHGDKILSNVEWGSGVVVADSKQTAQDAAKAIEVLSNKGETGSLADGKLKEFMDGLTLSDTCVSTDDLIQLGDGKDGYRITGLEAGYYLIKDKNSSLNGRNDSYTSYMMKVIGNVTTKPKSSLPTAEKKVKDTCDSASPLDDSWQDSADYDIGDQVPFELKAYVADNYGAYSKYQFRFHDQMDEGFTLLEDSFAVKIGDQKLADSDYDLVLDDLEEDSFQVYLSDLKALEEKYQLSIDASTSITVDYSARLNEGASIGATGNSNSMYLEYSNNPNHSFEENVGKTPYDEVKVFTYQLEIKKTDLSGQALAGAEFTLYKLANDKKTVLSTLVPVMNDEKTVFTFAGLDDGDYVLSETKTPAGYNTIKDISFTIEASHEKTATHPTLLSLSGDVEGGRITMSPNASQGRLTADVVNTKGFLFPETGGMGSKIFTMIGLMLIGFAAVLFAWKKWFQND